MQAWPNYHSDSIRTTRFVPKLAFYANRMAFQPLWAGSDNADTVYGPDDSIRPVIFNMGEACTVTLTVELQDEKGKTLEKKTFKNISVPEGRSVTRLNAFRFHNKSEGCRFIVYRIQNDRRNTPLTTSQNSRK